MHAAGHIDGYMHKWIVVVLVYRTHLGKSASELAPHCERNQALEISEWLWSLCPLRRAGSALEAQPRCKQRPLSRTWLVIRVHFQVGQEGCIL